MEPVKINQGKLIITEGIDAYYFCIWALGRLEIEDIQVFNYGGITQLTKYIKLLKLDDNFDNVKSIIIFRDAEGDAQSAFQSIQTSLRVNGLPVPNRLFEPEDNGNVKISCGLFPGLDSSGNVITNGTLEDLCLMLIEHDHKVDCVDEFLNCASSNEYAIKQVHKAKLHAYLSISNDYIGLKIGEAAKAGAFDWDSDAFKPFKELLISA